MGVEPAPTSALPPQEPDALLVEAERLRAAMAFGRSRKLIGLFDYLVAQAKAGHQPKEVEIAMAVFHRSADFDAMQDASVRVYAHKLRRRLDEAYAAAPQGTLRLVLPPGEYRLGLTSIAADESTPMPSLTTEGLTHRLTGRHLALAGFALLLLAVAGLGLWRMARPDRPAPPAPFAALLANGKPTVIVVGDYYLVAETDGMEVKRLVREFDINSPVELQTYLATSRHAPSYEDSGIRYLPTSAGYATARVSAALASYGQPAPDVLLASELTPERLRTSNLVYIGYYSGLGALRDIVTQVSHFQTGPSFDELTDTTSGRHYVSQEAYSYAPNLPYREFGSVMSFGGPDGTRIIVLAGTRDVAVRQLTDTLLRGRPEADSAVTRNLSGDGEVLFEVTGLNGVNVQAHALSGARIGVKALWAQSASQP